MKIPLIILLLLFFQTNSTAQNTDLELVVVDQSSSIIPNVAARLIKDDKTVKEAAISEPQNIVFANIIPGGYTLEIKAAGFSTSSEEIEIRAGTNKKIVRLEIEQIVENVTVENSLRDKNLDPREGAFTNFLTRAEIESLPDDPEQLLNALKQKFGDDAEFFVDSFSSGRLPRKSEIASIKVNQSSFDAEHHKIGIPIIEITTKPTSKFFGILNFDFNDAVLNARETFSPNRNASQNKNFGLLLWGPIKKDKLSFSASAGYNTFYNTAVIKAALPDGVINNPEKSSSNQKQFNGKITYIPSPFQTINFNYSFNRSDSLNLGIGEFDLTERAFDSHLQSNQIRYSQSGTIGKAFYNEFRFQFFNEVFKTIPATDAATIIVLDAFKKGGAGNNAIAHRQDISIADNFLWGIKNHALKIGGVLDYRRRNILSEENRSGTFIYSSLYDYGVNRPSLFIQESGNRTAETAQIQFGAFIQDDFRLNKSLMLNLGLRYERQSDLKDGNNFSPRIGFAWSPTEMSKTTLRGGIGLFYNWLETDTLNAIQLRGENQPGTTIIINPGFPNPYSAGTIEILPKSFRLKASNLESPYVFLAQFGVQRQLSLTSSLRIQYSYQKGVHQFRSRDLNAPLNRIRPDADFGQISYFESSAFFVKNTLKIDYDVSPTKNTFLSVDYRLAKNISDSGGSFALPSDNYNLRSDRSVANDDQRHTIYATFSWNLLKGLRLSTIYRAASPLPYTITTGRDDNGDTVFNDRPNGISRNSERGMWQKQFNASLGWQINLEKNNDNMSISSDPNSQVIKGKTLFIDIASTNIFNQTNLQTFVGNQTSVFFRQPISAAEPRRIKFNLRFSF